MLWQELISLYSEDDRVKKICERIEENDKHRKNLHLKGVVGSVVSFIVAATYKNLQHHHIFILNDKEEAVYFLNDLDLLFEKKKELLFLPDSFKKSGEFSKVDSGNILLRTETINKLIHSIQKGEIIVTYPEALLEKVVVAEELNKQVIYITKGEKLDGHFITDVLLENGFVRSDFVYEPGQFSVRGGIIDIFSFGNELPYRVELFDDEVESIRVFQPVDQLSVKNISQVTIIPNIQTQFKAENKQSFFASLPHNTVLWFRDAKYVFEKINETYSNALEWFDLASENHLLEEEHPFREHPPKLLLEHIENQLSLIHHFPVIEFGLQAYLKESYPIHFHTAPQPLFHKNFELLLADFKKNNANHYSNFLFVTNAKQEERFYQIFHDLDSKIAYTSFIKPISNGFIDHDLKIACYTDHQIFERYHKYTIKSGFAKNDAITLRQLMDLKQGDYVTHIDHGVGIYSGLEKIDVNGQQQECVRIIYQNNDLLYVHINSLHKISKYAGKDSSEPKLNKLGSDVWEATKRKAKNKIKDIAKDLIAIYAKRKAQKGYAFAEDSYLQNELEASFIYEDTPDQEKATLDVKKDMENSYPMDRLVCGDVGFGKTEIAIRAAFKAVNDNKQVAVLVPTTILAWQHYKTFSERFRDFPCTVDFLSRFKSGKEKKETLQNIEQGKTDVIIGTHALIAKQVKFKNLGLLIIDEEQKFGVGSKEKIRAIKSNIDTLTLTATPIPRTLQFSLMGARDLSIINTPPPNRQPIQTELKTFDADFIRDAIYFEIYRGGQVFFIHNRVRDIQEVAGLIKKVCPDIQIGVAHGQLEAEELENQLLKFLNKEYDVLVCTNIVESGIDIANANTIIINNAHWFGLSDIHQLRGRVGRSNKKAYCYLISPPLYALPDDSRKRLKTIEQYSELGSGFQISMQDLDIRGAGNILGAEQSGFITDIGYDTYHKILDEAIRELKHTEYKDIFKEQIEEKQDFVKDVQIDTDLEMLIPDKYISNIAERMSIYTRLDHIESEEGIQLFAKELEDRFGKIPKQVNELFNGIRLRWVAKELGFERIIFKNKKLRCYFIENQNSVFYDSNYFQQLLNFIAEKKTTGVLKQTDKHLILIFEQVQSMKHAKELLEKIKPDAI